MNLQEFHQRRQDLANSQRRYRSLCNTCLQPEFGCYCRHLHRFDPKIKFVILIHPIEVKRRIATGRMSHLCLEKSLLVRGQDFSENEQVNEILQDSHHQCFVLYPGKNSLNVSEIPELEKWQIFSPQKMPTVFVIDGTWATARRMIRQSKNLVGLPRVCFTPPGVSRFRVRKQPAPECLSTIEAIHHSIETFGPYVGFNTSSREHDKLLFVFDKMVERQLDCIRDSYDNPKPKTYRPPRVRVV